MQRAVRAVLTVTSFDVNKVHVETPDAKDELRQRVVQHSLLR